MSTKIEWLQAPNGEWIAETWNPCTGCTPAGVGCLRCYAARVAHRGMSPQHRGLTRATKDGIQWTGEVRTVPSMLDRPLRWRKPRMVMVPSMSDLFHRDVPFEYVAAVFGVMAACPRHFFVIPTKRTARSREFSGWFAERASEHGPHAVLHDALGLQFNSVHPEPTLPLDFESAYSRACEAVCEAGWELPWPLPNVGILASVSTQADADRLLPDLLECPAALIGVSYEPAIEDVDFRSWLPGQWRCSGCGLRSDGRPGCKGYCQDPTGGSCDAVPCPRCGRRHYWSGGGRTDAALSWLIGGAESGPGRRPAELDWFRSARDQCIKASVPYYLKQADVGGKVVSRPELDGKRWAQLPEAVLRVLMPDVRRG